MIDSDSESTSLYTTHLDDQTCKQVQVDVSFDVLPNMYWLHILTNNLHVLFRMLYLRECIHYKRFHSSISKT